MNLSTRLFRVLILVAFVIITSSINQISYAEEDDVREVTVEAIYKMSDTDTPAKAEEQVLLRAKRNALEQASSANLTMENIIALPEDALSVVVLDKHRALNGNTMECWIQIKATIHPSKIETALKNANTYMGRPAEYYQEVITYMNGKQVTSGKLWFKKGFCRTEDTGSDMICITKSDNGKSLSDFRGTILYIRNNKYCEIPMATLDPNIKVQNTEEKLGTEIINNITADKIKYTQIVSTNPNKKTVSLKWIDPTNNLTLKDQYTDEDGTIYSTEYKNLSIGPQNSALFEAPANFIRCPNLESLWKDGNVTPNTQNSDPAMNLLDQAGQRILDQTLGNLFNF